MSTPTEPDTPEAAAGRARRLRYILGAMALVLAVVLGLNFRAISEVNREISRIRSTAPTVTISEQDIIESAYGAPDTLAQQFGISGSDVQFTQEVAGDWCVTVRVSRLLTERSISFNVSDSRLVETEGC